MIKKFLLSIICLTLLSSSASAYFEVLYDTVEVKWPNGNIKEYYTRYWFTANEKGFQPHGLYSTYYENGQLNEQGHYQWNVKIGTWTRWDENGNRLEDIDYFDGLKSGQYVEWYADNTFKIFGYYNNDRKNGLWVYHKPAIDLNNPDLYIDSVLFYRNDTLMVALEGNQGEWRHPNPWYYNGDYDLWIEWKRHNAIDILTNYEYFYIGKKADGIKYGQWIKLAPNAEIISIDYFKDGEMVKVEELLE